MPLHDSYDIYLEVDGARLQEYDVAFDGSTRPPTVSCWIPSQSGKTFIINCDNMNVPRHGTKYIYVIDGVGVGGLISRADHGPFSSPSPKCPMADVSVGDTWRQLQFADIELTDDDEALSRQPNPSLGEIRIQVQPTLITSPPYSLIPEVITLATGKVHERSKKAGVHSVGLGPVSKTTSASSVNIVDCGPPIFTFVFRYRPLALLQAQGIAPPPTPAPSPTPPPAPRLPSPDVEIKSEGGVDDADEDEEIRRLRAQIESLKKRKRAAEPKIKSEPAAQRPRTSAMSNDVIDLTSD